MLQPDAAECEPVKLGCAEVIAETRLTQLTLVLSIIDAKQTPKISLINFLSVPNYYFGHEGINQLDTP